MAVIGAGPIGIELAQAFQRFGSQVTVLSCSDKILPKEDPDAAKIIETSLRRDGVTFSTDSWPSNVEETLTAQT